MRLLFVLILFGLFLQACSTRVGYTIFLKETDSHVENLQGKVCTESGYKIDTEGTQLVTYYDNCEVHLIRSLEEKEIQLWKPSK